MAVVRDILHAGDTMWVLLTVEVPRVVWVSGLAARQLQPRARSVTDKSSRRMVRATKKGYASVPRMASSFKVVEAKAPRSGEVVGGSMSANPLARVIEFSTGPAAGNASYWVYPLDRLKRWVQTNRYHPGITVKYVRRKIHERGTTGKFVASRALEGEGDKYEEAIIKEVQAMFKESA